LYHAEVGRVRKTRQRLDPMRKHFNRAGFRLSLGRRLDGGAVFR
jgi:hypothetical protein